MSTLTTALSRLFNTGLETAPLPARQALRTRGIETAAARRAGQGAAPYETTDQTSFRAETICVPRPAAAEFETARAEDVDDIETVFRQRSAPVGQQDPWRGFLRPTYDRKELLKALEEGQISVIRNPEGNVAAFALIVTDAGSPMVSLERFALRLAQFFDKDDKGRVLSAFERDKIVYIAAFATREGTNFDPHMMVKALQDLAEAYPDRTLLLTCSYRPVPNQRMRVLIEPYTRLLGQFSTPWKMGRPGRDGKYGEPFPKLMGVIPWIFGKWTSLIYEVDRSRLSKLAE